MIEEVSRPYLGPSPNPKGISNTLWRCLVSVVEALGTRMSFTFLRRGEHVQIYKCKMCKAHGLEVFFDHLNYFSF